MRHFGIGRAHKGRPVRLLIDHDDVLVADLNTGTILAELTIDPTRGYQAKRRTPAKIGALLREPCTETSANDVPRLPNGGRGGSGTGSVVTCAFRT